jgi:PAS domain S-box-containing protein
MTVETASGAMLPLDVLLDLIAASPDALLAVDADGLIVFANHRCDDVFGWASDELCGRAVEVLIPSRQAEQHAAHRRAYLRHPSPRPMGAGLQLRGLRKDGSEFPADISINAVAGGRTVVVAVRDVTERLQMEADRRQAADGARELQTQALASLGELSGGIAHDFNNLLGVILNFATLLERQTDDPTTRDDIAQVRLAAERGSWLTRQLLTFAHPDPGPVRLLCVHDTVEQAAEMLRRTMPVGVELVMTSNGDECRILGSEHAVHHILLHLAVNSCDAMPDGGVLTISTDSSTDRAGRTVATITVSDSGRGMPPHIAARAFEPFVTTKARRDGSGLGLSIVNRLVAGLGGILELESTLGHGTTVTARLPATPGAGAARTQPADNMPVGRSRGACILMVEDDVDLRSSTERLLTEYGYRVVATANGSDALARYDELGSAVDIVITDLIMRGIDGDSLAAELARRDSRLPVIAVTGFGHERPVSASAVLTKPYSVHDLLGAVDRAFGERDG